MAQLVFLIFNIYLIVSESVIKGDKNKNQTYLRSGKVEEKSIESNGDYDYDYYESEEISGKGIYVQHSHCTLMRFL